MRKNDARQLDHATLEAMRERAVQSVQQGESPEDVARVLGINRSTIYKWLAEYRQASNLSELGPFHSVVVLIKARLGNFRNPHFEHFMCLPISGLERQADAAISVRRHERGDVLRTVANTYATLAILPGLLAHVSTCLRVTDD